MTYDCPDCGWDPIDIEEFGGSFMLFYYIKKGKALPIYNSWIEVDEKTGQEEPNYQKIKRILKRGHRVYPIRTNGCHIPSTVMGPGGDIWDEIHCCPKCNKEFQFENANY